MENKTPRKPDNYSYDEKVEIDVPDLKDLYDFGFMNMTKEVYLDYKKNNNCKFLSKLDDELASIYVAYLSVINFIDENNISDEQLLHFLNPTNTDDINTVKEIIKADCSICEGDFEISSKNHDDDMMDYAREVIAISLSFERHPNIINFMKIVNNSNIKNAIRVYFLDHDLKLENMGIVPLKSIYDDAEYYAYKYFYGIYLEYSSGYSKVRKSINKIIPILDENIVRLRNLSKIAAIDAVNNCLSDLNQRLYKEEEFYKMRDSRRQNFGVISELVTSQYEKLKSEGFYNEKTR